MNDRDATIRDQGYIEGRRRTLLNLLQHTLVELHGFKVPEDDSVFRMVQLIREREEVLAVLRRVCADHGDNDWPECLNLADVLESHLLKYVLPSKP